MDTPPKIQKNDNRKEKWAHMLKQLKTILKVIGPGFITGVADDDPSGVATYSQTGAKFGFSQLWLSLFTFPFMIVIQQMCGRIGMVNNEGQTGRT